MRLLKKLIGKGKKYLESDNKGTFQGDVDAATEYWERRKKLKKFDPFLLYEFGDTTDAVAALMGLDFIKIAHDTEELISLKSLIYGYYELENGHYEVVLCGNELDEKTIMKAEQVFKQNKGKIINSKKPEKKKCPVEVKSEPVKIEKKPEVEFVKEEKVVKRGIPYTFTIYKAKTKADAVLFLQTKLVVNKSHVVIVKTPRGSFGRNYSGIFIPEKKAKTQGADK
jgi:hypothetical protein